MTAQAPAADLDVWLAPQATSDVNSIRGGVRIRTGHLDINLRFPVAMPPGDCAAILAQIEASVAARKAAYIQQLGAVVPTQRPSAKPANDVATEWIG